MFAFASKVGISIAEGDETVAVIPACYDLSRVKETAKNCDTMIFLKDGRYFDQVIVLLREAGFPDSSLFAIAQDVGTNEEIVKKLTLGEVTKDTLTSNIFQLWWSSVHKVYFVGCGPGDPELITVKAKKLIQKV